MNKSLIAHRQRVVKSAVGSVQAEGPNPSAQTKKLLEDYANGTITAAELRAITLRGIKDTVKTA